MSGRRIVIALGGNALGRGLAGQMAAVKETAKVIADLVEDGDNVIISHGNGPQVGMIQNAFTEYRRVNPDEDLMPLSVCVAMSQGFIGYDLQNALREELLDRGIDRPAATVLTQVIVDPDDPAFLKPTKPVGAFLTEAEARRMESEKGWTMAEDSGRGWRRVVASPKPQEIVEIGTVRALTEAGQIVIAAGGGGIPVRVEGEHHLKGVSAVIDKDFAAEKLAEQIGADVLVILTAVDAVCLDFGKPTQRSVSSMTAAEARGYIADGQFPAGSMCPKVEASVLFAESGNGRYALITSPEKARDGLRGTAGTIIKV